MSALRWDEPHEWYVRRAAGGRELPSLEAVGFRRDGMTVVIAFVVRAAPGPEERAELASMAGELIADFAWEEYRGLEERIGTRAELDLTGFALVEVVR